MARDRQVWLTWLRERPPTSRPGCLGDGSVHRPRRAWPWRASGPAWLAHHARGPWLELLAGSAEPVLRALLDLDPSATEVTVTEPSLEEAFLALTSDMEAAQ